MFTVTVPRQGKTSQEEVDPTVRDLAQGQDEGHAWDLLFLGVQFSYVRGECSVLEPGMGTRYPNKHKTAHP